MGASQSVQCDSLDRALKIPVILKHILSFCRPQDLLECRLVSRHWERESRSVWSTRIRMEFRCFIKVMQFSDFVEDVNRDKYYANFYLCVEDANMIVNPFDVMRPENIKILELHGHHFRDRDAYRNLLFKWTPNMQVLTLRGILVPEENPEDVKEKCTNFDLLEMWNLRSLNIIEGEGFDWMELLSNFPAIENLLVDGITGWDRFFKSCNKIRRMDSSKLNLKRFTALDCYQERNITAPSEIFKMLTSRSLSFESLSLEMNGDKIESILEAVLMSNMTSLKKLELERNVSQQLLLDTDQVFGRLGFCFENLTEICLHSRIFTSLSFLKFTPNLVKFKVSPNNSNLDDEQQNIVAQTGHLNVTLMHCRELEYSELLPVDDLNCLIDWFPKVEILKICLDDTTFPIVLERWPNLVNLNITESCISEDTLTGLDKEYIHEVNKGEDDYVPSYMTRPPTVPWKNISWLGNLRTFVLTAPPDKWYECSFGLVSAEFIFQQMKELKQIYVEGYELEYVAWTPLMAYLDYSWTHYKFTLQCSKK